MRVELFSDGVYAASSTGLMIELLGSMLDQHQHDDDEAGGGGNPWPRLVNYCYCFHLVARLHRVHQTIVGKTAHFDQDLLALNSLACLLVAFLPVLSTILGREGGRRRPPTHQPTSRLHHRIALINDLPACLPCACWLSCPLSDDRWRHRAGALTAAAAYLLLVSLSLLALMLRAVASGRLDVMSSGEEEEEQEDDEVVVGVGHSESTVLSTAPPSSSSLPVVATAQSMPAARRQRGAAAGGGHVSLQAAQSLAQLIGRQDSLAAAGGAGGWGGGGMVGQYLSLLREASNAPFLGSTVLGPSLFLDGGGVSRITGGLLQGGGGLPSHEGGEGRTSLLVLHDMDDDEDEDDEGEEQEGVLVQGGSSRDGVGWAEALGQDHLHNKRSSTTGSSSSSLAASPPPLWHDDDYDDDEGEEDEEALLEALRGARLQYEVSSVLVLPAIALLLTIITAACQVALPGDRSPPLLPLVFLLTFLCIPIERFVLRVRAFKTIRDAIRQREATRRRRRREERKKKLRQQQQQRARKQQGAASQPPLPPRMRHGTTTTTSGWGKSRLGEVKEEEEEEDEEQVGPGDEGRALLLREEEEEKEGGGARPASFVSVASTTLGAGGPASWLRRVTTTSSEPTEGPPHHD